MFPHRYWKICTAVCVLALCPVAPASAAIKVRKPILDAPAPLDLAPDTSVSREEGTYFVGTVIFSRGNQVVAEIPEGVREGERLVIYGMGFLRQGKARALKPLEGNVFLLELVGGASASPGDRLAFESETEAAARVIRENTLGAYEEFMQLFPRSIHRPRMSREMFRLTMKETYPTFPGSTIEGRIRLVETTGRELTLGQVAIVLDNFIIARSDEDGRFRIEGVPKLRFPAMVKVRVKDDKFQPLEPVEIEVPAETFGELQVEVPVVLTPTVLVGQVVDSRGAPLPGVEVWTAPYSMEAFTDELGRYRISRRKNLEPSGTVSAEDEPLLGGEFEVYAHRKGYSVDRVLVSAQSFQENPVPPVQLVRQDARRQEIPDMGLALTDYLELSPAGAAPQGPAPKLNR